MSDENQSWYLFKNEDESVFGPVPFEQLKEWAMKFGPKYVAINTDLGRSRLQEDSDEMTEEYREIVRKYRTKPGA